MTGAVRFTSEAFEDMDAIYKYIEANADAATADAYINRIEEACARLTLFPNRGTPRQDLRPGLRSIAFERRAVIVYTVFDSEVVIVAVAHGGRDLGGMFDD